MPAPKAKSQELFSALDSDGDGQLTSTEFSDNFSNLLYSAQGTMGKRPAPPEDSGLSKDELTAMLQGGRTGRAKVHCRPAIFVGQL